MHDRRDRARDPLALERRDPQAGRLEIRRHARARGRDAAARPGATIVSSSSSTRAWAARVVRGAHERDDVAVGLLEHAREQLHPDEAGGAGEQQRAGVGGGGHAASRHSDALWPPNPNEFDRATGGRPLDICSARAVPGT